MMEWPSAADLADLIERFGRAAVPASEFTHGAHLVVGLWHADRYDAARALEEMRTGILRLNQAHGTPNSDSRGYHETITRAYLALLAEFRVARRHEALDVSARALLDSPLAARDVLLIYYSRDLLMSRPARRAWIEPDRRPLRLAALHDQTAHGVDLERTEGPPLERT